MLCGSLITGETIFSIYLLAFWILTILNYLLMTLTHSSIGKTLCSRGKQLCSQEGKLSLGCVPKAPGEAGCPLGLGLLHPRHH